MIVRTVLFPVRLALGVGKLSAKGGFKAGRASVVGTYKAGSLLGYRRMATLGAGIGIGLLIAPTSGQELRETLKQRLAERSSGAGDGDEAVAERARQKLSQSPRTWHLPQPEVDVVAGTAVLTGTAPHATAKADLEDAVRTVEGVVAVDSRIEVGVMTVAVGDEVVAEAVAVAVEPEPLPPVTPATTPDPVPEPSGDALPGDAVAAEGVADEPPSPPSPPASSGT
jgi:osmotically-inducible protein OsmY